MVGAAWWELGSPRDSGGWSHGTDKAPAWDGAIPAESDVEKYPSFISPALSLPLAPYPTSVTWKPAGKGPWKCDFMQYRAQQSLVRQGRNKKKWISEWPIMWIEVIIFLDVQQFLHSIIYSLRCQIIYVLPTLCKIIFFLALTYTWNLLDYSKPHSE